ncbi:MAG: MATE family efflux transporter [Bacillota bacterium]
MPKMNDAERRHFMLTGKLWYVIFVIASPMILMNIMNFMYNLVDLTLVADISSLAVSAVATTNQIKNTANSVSQGLSIAATIILARAIGANDFEKAKRLSRMILVFALGACILLCCTGLFLSEAIMAFCNVPESIIEISGQYFAVQMITLGIGIFNAIYLSFEKSRGATTKIFTINFVLIVTKIILTIIFLEIHAEIISVALATLVPNIFFFIFVIYKLGRKDYTYKFERKQVEFRKDDVKSYFKIVWPIFVSKFVFTSGKVISNAIAADLGDTVVGSMSVSNNLGAATTTITESTEETISVIISQNLGNNNPRRAVNVFYIILAFNVVVSFIGMLVYTIWMNQLVGHYAGSDPEFYETIYSIFKYERWGVLGLGVNSAVIGFLLGFGYTKMTFVLNIFRLFCLRIPSLYILINFTTFGAEAVGISMLLSNGGIGCISLTIGLICLRKVKKKYGLIGGGNDENQSTEDKEMESEEAVSAV